jgi:hypothetical protein
MQPISFSKVNGCHPDTSTTVIATIVGLDRLAPEFADLRGAFIETNINKEVTVRGVGLKVLSSLVCGPLLDMGAQELGAIPATKLACALRFEVERGSKRDDSLDLRDV